MKKEQVLINTLAGTWFNERDLLDALNRRHISAAAIDVWQSEPLVNRRLARHPNVIMTPHIASLTTEASYDVANIILQRILSHAARDDRYALQIQPGLSVQILSDAGADSQRLIGEALLQNISSQGFTSKPVVNYLTSISIIYVFRQPTFLQSGIKWSDRNTDLSFMLVCKSCKATTCCHGIEHFIEKRTGKRELAVLGYVTLPHYADLRLAVFNVSSSGLGVYSHRELAVDTEVVWHKSSREIYRGQVRWCSRISDHEFHCGVRLHAVFT